MAFVADRVLIFGVLVFAVYVLGCWRIKGKFRALKKQVGKFMSFLKWGVKTVQITDPIADFLTRIRNAYCAKHDSVDVPASKIKREMSKILVDEGYVRRFSFLADGKQGIIKIILKYNEMKVPAITGLKRVSKPGFRVHSGVGSLPKVMKGLGVAIISTPKGIMTDRHARFERVGGEVLAYVW